MSFEIPASIESDVQQFAVSHHISMDEAIVTLLKSGLSNSAEPLDHIFTPERLAELGQISEELKNGGEKFSLDQVEAHFAIKGEAWRASHKN